MMHKKNFVAAVKVDGKILRESSDRVELPFGSEYSIFLKNLDTVRMQAQISIDGQDASGWLVLQPKEMLDVERFFRGNKDKGHRFKFIERTQAVEDHRGVEAEDGLIRIEFKREKVYEAPQVVIHSYPSYPYIWPYYYPRYEPYNFCGTLNSGGSTVIRSSDISRGCFKSGHQSINNSNASYSGPISAPVVVAGMSAMSTPNDAGITVDGSLSNQRFISVAGFETEKSEAIVLHLVGRKAEAIVKVAKTVDLKPECNTCGKKNKANSKFCTECGTSLEKI